jgi:hypothetical protein
VVATRCDGAGRPLTSRADGRKFDLATARLVQVRMQPKLKESAMNDLIELGTIVEETKFNNDGKHTDLNLIPTKTP